MKQKVALIAIVAVALNISNVSAKVEPWSMYGGNPMHNFSSSEQINFPLSLAWSVNAGGGFACKNGPGFSDKMYFIPLVSGAIQAVNSLDGSVAWTKTVSNLPLISKPAYSGSFVICATQEGEVFSLDSLTGEIKYKFVSDYIFLTSPVIIGGIVYISSKDGILLRLTLQGLYPTGSLPLKTSVVIDPIKVDDKLLVSGADGKCSLITKLSGIVWTRNLEGPVQGTPTYSDKSILLVCGDNSLYNLSSDTGKDIWSLPMGEKCENALLSDINQVYIVTNNGTIRAVSIPKGTAVWNQKANGPVLGKPAIAAGKIYVATWEKWIHSFTTAAGERVWQKRSSQGFFGGLVATQNGVLALPQVGEGQLLSLSTGKLSWSLSIGGLCRTAPTTDSERAYFTQTDGSVRAVHIGSGQVLWKTNIGGEIWCSPAIKGRKAIVCANYQPATCIDTYNGSILWKSDVQDFVNSSPTVDGTNVYMGAWDGRIYCINVADGKRQWTTQTSDVIFASPSVSTDNLVVGSLDKSIYNMDNSTGAIKWLHSVGQSIQKSICLTKELAFYPTQSYVRCLDIRSGSMLWEASLNGTVLGEIALKEDYLYAFTDNGSLYVLDKLTGERLDYFNTDAERLQGFIIVDDKAIITAGTKILIFDLSLGRKIWEYDCKSEVSPPVYSSGRLFVSTVNGSLLCFVHKIGNTGSQEELTNKDEFIVPLSTKETLKRATELNTTPNEIPIF